MVRKKNEKHVLVGCIMAVRRSSRVPNVKRIEQERDYWEKIIEEEGDDKLVILTHTDGFKSYWYGRYSSYRMKYNIIRDVFKRGFLIYCINDTLHTNSYTLNERKKLPNERNPKQMESGIYIDSAFVNVNARKKQVLTKMFRKLLRRYPKKVISLLSMKEALPVWLKLGFVTDPFWNDQYHLVRFPGKKGGIY